LGDGTSFTVITTKPASKDFHGSAEIRGSLDGYNNFLGAVSVSGPILKGKKRDDPARIGFLLSGEASYDHDNSPARGGNWRASQEIVDFLIKNPLRYSGTEFGVYKQEAAYLTSESFHKQRVRNNAGVWNYLGQGKIEFLFGKTKNVRFSVGGSYEYTKGQSWSRSGALFNSLNGPESKGSTLRLNARLNHRVYTDTTGVAILKNIMYDINVSYTRVNSVTEDVNHKDRLFDYGYIGKFTSHMADAYQIYKEYTMDSINYYQNVFVLENRYDSLITFQPGTQNPDLVYYTQNFYDNFTPEIINDRYGQFVPYDYVLYQKFGALRNGDSPNGVYTLYSMPGTVYNGYSKAQQEAIGLKASISMNLQNHELKIGYEFEKLKYRGFSASPRTLWTLMRDKTNSHIKELDLANPVITMGDTITIWYPRLVNYDAQSEFDRNIRSKLGYGADEWIDIDNLAPSTFSLSDFAAEELLLGTSRSPLVSYYGYDYTGERKYNKKTSIADFFAKDPETGKRHYNIGAYEPIYMAFYIQDKFAINSLIFNVGLRVDYFNANQSVLKDPYLFRAAYTVGDLVNAKVDRGQMLNSAGDDWYVYVNQKNGHIAVNDLQSNFNAESIVGYRNGDTWYNAQGQEVTDPEAALSLNTSGPLLKNAIDKDDITKVEADAFTKYSPQWSPMPRISFSFPVSDNSLFYAHYNIITSRPTNLQLNPINYLFIEDLGNSSANTISNPDLKPQKSIDYEIGFRQKIGEKSAISIAAYYSEKRDMVQSYRFTGAYPTTYYSFKNIDFGTVQGFTLSYELRRVKNISFRANYTLQFAKGTGSSAGSNLAIIASGQPNLRTLTNLSFDQRHRIGANIDYRFESGVDYNGPKTRKVKKGTNTVKEIRWLENAGITLLFSAASGMPYSRSSTPNSIYVDGTAKQLSGSINGSHMPWIFQCDLRIDKTFMLNLYGKDAKDKEGNSKGVKPGYLTVYLDVQNLFNFKNVVYVYDYTGNPEDDGYLSATEYQQQINSQIYVPSYINYYNMMVQDPYNYSMPTRVSLGIQFGF
ncbi:MAG: TonB-dependent receptor, partial [Bacteroidales bacterium]